MKTPLVIILFCVLAITVYGQVPFKTPSRDIRDITITEWNGRVKNAKTVNLSTIDFKDNLTPFSEGNFNVQASGDFSSVLPAVKLDFIRYRLNLFTRIRGDAGVGNEYKEGDTIRYYIPLYILSKFTTNYDTSQTAAIEDATSFLGSPFTFRLAPNYSFRIGKENVLNVGVNADFRMLLSKDSVASKLDPSVGFYGSLGLSYFGTGSVRDEAGQTHNGTWVASFLLYGYMGDKESRILLFREEEEDSKLKSGLEFLFQFKLFDTKITRFNLNASMKYDFYDIPGQKPYSFKFGIGS